MRGGSRGSGGRTVECSLTANTRGISRTILVLRVLYDG